MSELKEQIADLIIENARIKKTSGNRFEQIKSLKQKEKHLDTLLSRFSVLREFLVGNNFTIKSYECQERIDFSLMNAIRGLLVKADSVKKVSVAGSYTVKIDGKYKLAKIYHNACWWITFDLDSDTPKYDGLHNVDVSEFILLELN